MEFLILYFSFIAWTVRILLFCAMTNKCTIISQIITLLHVSTLSCHPQTACNQYLAKLHQYFKCSCWYCSLLFCALTYKCTIISQIITLLHVSTLSCHPQTACNQYLLLWPTNAQLFHKLSHTYMFRHYRVILRQPVINTLPSYTSISNAAVGNTVYN